jgi:hypothetical protein
MLIPSYQSRENYQHDLIINNKFKKVPIDNWFHKNRAELFIIYSLTYSRRLEAIITKSF